jgi:hypothetical protein
MGDPPPTGIITLSLLFKRIEPCFAAHVAHTCNKLLNNIVDPESGVTIFRVPNTIWSRRLFERSKRLCGAEGTSLRRVANLIYPPVFSSY